MSAVGDFEAAPVPLAAIQAGLERTGMRVASGTHALDLSEAQQAARQFGTPPLWVKSIGERHPRFCMELDNAADLPLGFVQASHRSTVPGVYVQQAVRGTVYRMYLDRSDTGCAPVILEAELGVDSQYRVVMEIVVHQKLDPALRDALLEAAAAAAALVQDPRRWLELELVWTSEGPTVTDLWLSEEPTAIATVLRGAGLDRLMRGEGGIPALAVAWISSRSGVVRKIEGVDSARAEEGVLSADVLVSVGDTIGHVIDKASRDRLGFVLSAVVCSSRARMRACPRSDGLRRRDRARAWPRAPRTPAASPEPTCSFRASRTRACR